MSLSLEDQFAIQEVMIRYAYGIDVECTEEEFLDLFTEDALMVSPYSGIHQGVEGVKKFRQRFVPRRGKVQVRHLITNYLIEGGGDEATLKAYFVEYKTDLEVPVPQRRTEYLFGGSYDCTLRRSGGKWRLARRIVHIDDQDNSRSRGV